VLKYAYPSHVNRGLSCGSNRIEAHKHPEMPFAAGAACPPERVPRSSRRCDRRLERPKPSLAPVMPTSWLLVVTSSPTRTCPSGSARACRSTATTLDLLRRRRARLYRLPGGRPGLGSLSIPRLRRFFGGRHRSRVGEDRFVMRLRHCAGCHPQVVQMSVHDCPPSRGRSVAWLADRNRDPTPINPCISPRDRLDPRASSWLVSSVASRCDDDFRLGARN
jgi:hypothetical protein